MSIWTYLANSRTHLRERFQLPSVCPLCYGRAYRGEVCLACWQDLYADHHSAQERCQYCQVSLLKHEINPVHDKVCQACHEHKLAVSRIYYGFDYLLPIDSLILRFKNARQQTLGYPLAKLVYQRLLSEQSRDFPWPQPPLLIPIPSSKAALKRRGYNPATEFAKSFAKLVHAPLELKVLHREESQTQQKSLSRQARLLASAHSYYCAYRLDRPHVVLIDDIMTSGSTLDSAARALLAAGVQQVDALVIARARHHY